MHTTKRGEPLPINQALNRPRAKLGLDLSAWMAIVILQLSDVAIPSAAHHLIETLQSFIPFDPIPVFHAIAAVVRSAKSWGYQYESLAVELLVKVTENYIAEHRMELQMDRQSREELIDILETFVEAGWPSARRLSYRLEEIFR